MTVEPKKGIASLSLAIPLYFHKYKVNFDAVFSVTELRDHFRTYLIESQQTASELSFLFEFKHIQRVELLEERINAFLSMTNRYIKPGADKELNIHTSNRKEILEWAAEVLANKSAMDPTPYFEITRNNLYVELKEDAFPRYVRSQQFMSFVIAKGEDFLKQISFEVANMTSLDKYFPKDLVSDTVTEKDLRWAFAVSEGKLTFTVTFNITDSHDWRLVSDNKVQQIDPCNHFCIVDLCY